jgi:hypothetical protein
MDERRNLSKGQQAMAMAMVYPDAQRGGKREKGSSLVSKHNFSSARLSHARTVLRSSPPLAQQVIAGKKSLDEAMTVVRQYEHHAATTPRRIYRKRSGSPP